MKTRDVFLRSADNSFSFNTLLLFTSTNYVKSVKRSNVLLDSAARCSSLSCLASASHGNPSRCVHSTSPCSPWCGHRARVCPHIHFCLVFKRVWIIQEHQGKVFSVSPRLRRTRRPDETWWGPPRLLVLLRRGDEETWWGPPRLIVSSSSWDDETWWGPPRLLVLLRRGDVRRRGEALHVSSVAASLFFHFQYWSHSQRKLKRISLRVVGNSRESLFGFGSFLCCFISLFVLWIPVRVISSSSVPFSVRLCPSSTEARDNVNSRWSCDSLFKASLLSLLLLLERSHYFSFDSVQRAGRMM